MPDLVPIEQIQHAILTIRGQRVMLDADLAELYGVEVRALNQAVRRNLDRFPEDFAFALTAREWEDLKSQSVTSSSWGGRRKVPYAFTEQGVAMLSGVLTSPRAIAVNVEIMRAFVRMRRFLAGQEELARRMEALEGRADLYDDHFRVLFEAMALLTEPPEPPIKAIGFRTDDPA